MGYSVPVIAVTRFWMGFALKVFSLFNDLYWRQNSIRLVAVAAIPSSNSLQAQATNSLLLRPTGPRTSCGSVKYQHLRNSAPLLKPNFKVISTTDAPIELQREYIFHATGKQHVLDRRLLRGSQGLVNRLNSLQ